MNAVQFFIGMHSEMFSVVAMCVSNKDHLPVHGPQVLRRSSESNAVAETMSNLNFPVDEELPRQESNRVKALSFPARFLFCIATLYGHVRGTRLFTWLPR
jgi:hypothetical protein